MLQISQLFKIGSQNFEDMKQFSMCVEEALFQLSVHRDRALNYKTEEVQITAVDELYVEQDKDGHIDKQIARVRLFFLGFLAGKNFVTWHLWFLSQCMYVSLSPKNIPSMISDVIKFY
jgi:hypothetical protein